MSDRQTLAEVGIHVGLALDRSQTHFVYVDLRNGGSHRTDAKLTADRAGRVFDAVETLLARMVRNRRRGLQSDEVRNVLRWIDSEYARGDSFASVRA